MVLVILALLGGSLLVPGGEPARGARPQRRLERLRDIQHRAHRLRHHPTAACLPGTETDPPARPTASGTAHRATSRARACCPGAAWPCRRPTPGAATATPPPTTGRGTGATASIPPSAWRRSAPTAPARACRSATTTGGASPDRLAGGRDRNGRPAPTCADGDNWQPASATPSYRAGGPGADFDDLLAWLRRPLLMRASPRPDGSEPAVNARSKGPFTTAPPTRRTTMRPKETANRIHPRRDRDRAARRRPAAQAASWKGQALIGPAHASRTSPGPAQRAGDDPCLSGPLPRPPGDDPAAIRHLCSGGGACRAGSGNGVISNWDAGADTESVRLAAPPYRLATGSTDLVTPASCRQRASKVVSNRSVLGLPNGLRQRTGSLVTQLDIALDDGDRQAGSGSPQRPGGSDLCRQPTARGERARCVRICEA